MSHHLPGSLSYHSYYYQLSVSANRKRIWKYVFSLANIPFCPPHVLFNPAWFLTRPCDIFLSSLQFVIRVNGSRRSSRDLMHWTESTTWSTTDLLHHTALVISLFESPPFYHHGLTLQGPTTLSHSWVPPANAMNPRCSKVFERP